jgi:hypothetical protein
MRDTINLQPVVVLDAYNAAFVGERREKSLKTL